MSSAATSATTSSTDVEPIFGNKQADLIRFADTAAGEVTATREGLDLILTVDATGDTVRVKRQFEGREPSLFGGDFSPDTGVHEISFGDGTVWDRLDIARQVSHPLDGDESYIGTPSIDYLDGGLGNDFLSGGDEGDVYFFDRGYGRDQVRDAISNVLIGAQDIVHLGAGIALDDIEWFRDGGSNDLELRVAGTDDALVLLNQFGATYTGPLGVKWFDRIEVIVFDDGTTYNWREIMEKLVADAKTDGDDQIYGFAWQDTLDGGAGNDFLSGGNESDRYIFATGYGHDTIRGFQQQHPGHR